MNDSLSREADTPDWFLFPFFNISFLRGEWGVPDTLEEVIGQNWMDGWMDGWKSMEMQRLYL